MRRQRTRVADSLTLSGGADANVALHRQRGAPPGQQPPRRRALREARSEAFVSFHRAPGSNVVLVDFTVVAVVKGHAAARTRQRASSRTRPSAER